MLNKSPHFANYGAHHLLGSCDQTCWIAGVLFRSGDKKIGKSLNEKLQLSGVSGGLLWILVVFVTVYGYHRISI